MSVAADTYGVMGFGVDAFDPGSVIVKSVSSYISAVLADNPLVFWEMQETSGTTAADSSPNGNAGTYSGPSAPTLAQPGPLVGSTSVQFANGYVSSTNNQYVISTNLFDPAGRLSAGDTGHISLECWLLIASGPPAGSSGFASILGMVNQNNAGANTPDMYVRWDGFGVAYAYPYVSGAQFSVGATQLFDGEWHHLVLVATDSGYMIYIDGRQDSPLTSLSGVLYNSFTGGSTLKFAVGPWIAGGSYGVTGYIAFAAMYQSALSASRIATHFLSAPVLPSVGKIGQWDVDLYAKAWF